MNDFDVDGLEMYPTWLDDDAIEAIVAGDPVDVRLTHLAAFARGVSALADEPVPPASPALDAVFAGGITADRAGRRPSRVLSERLSRAAAKIAALGVAAKIGLGTAVAAAGVAGAGAAGTLPDQADTHIRGVIEAVTPVDFDDPTESEDDGIRFGDRVSRDATGASDGENGVDGREISEEAPGSANRPTDPGQGGLDRAEETPAAEHSPDDAGPPPHDPTGASPSATAPSTTPPPASTVPSTVPGPRGR